MDYLSVGNSACEDARQPSLHRYLVSPENDVSCCTAYLQSFVRLWGSPCKVGSRNRFLRTKIRWFTPYLPSLSTQKQQHRLNRCLFGETILLQLFWNVVLCLSPSLHDVLITSYVVPLSDNSSRRLDNSMGVSGRERTSRRPAGLNRKIQKYRYFPPTPH